MIRQNKQFRSYMGYLLWVALLVIISVKACKKFELEGFIQVSTSSVTKITATSAETGGDVTIEGVAEVTARGICWSTDSKPDLNDQTSAGGSGTGNFTVTLSGLSPSTTYYVRAFASNDEGTTYGEEKSFVTLTPAATPTVTTSPVIDITVTSATAGGNVTSDGGDSVTARGICWSTTSGPDISDNKTEDGSGTGIFSSSMTGLSKNTTYYVRAYAINSAGTGYGEERTFTTLDEETTPFVTTDSITEITSNSARSWGEVTGDGGAIVTARGVCWSTAPSPLVTGDHIESGNGTGTFTSVLSGLSPGTTYYVRAYATNSVGTSYGGEKTFTTLENSTTPFVTTDSITGITTSSAVSGGEVTSDGGAEVTARGVCWSKSPAPDISDDKTTDGIGTGSFTSLLSGLEPNTTYYLRAYATNSQGTSYGEERSFTTLEDINYPTVSTAPVTDIESSSVISGGEVTNDGGSPVTERGVCWSTSPEPDITDKKTSDGSGTGIFVSLVTQLTPNTTYYIRAYATNSLGTSYGIERSFTTLAAETTPTITTMEATSIKPLSAITGGDVIDDGGQPVTDRGVCWSTSPDPDLDDNVIAQGSGTGSFSIKMTGLAPGTTYYVRAYATNSLGSSYGNEISFTTEGINGTVKDYDNNTYQTILIGEQVWMAENLKVTRYADGSSILKVENNAAWSGLGYSDAAYCWYLNTTENRDAYGALYTWAAAMNNELSSTGNPSGVQGVCPDGWHLPSDEEWKELEMHVGMSREDADLSGYRGTDEGGKLKAAGTQIWVSPNTGATNESGFTALPGGQRKNDGTFGQEGYVGFFWTATQDDASFAKYRGIFNNSAEIFRDGKNKDYGYSVRCVMDP